VTPEGTSDLGSAEAVRSATWMRDASAERIAESKKLEADTGTLRDSLGWSVEPELVDSLG